ncbi:MAG: DUF5107 domain-containing protein, partial [Myxococcales bacterium]|nr:DUF5107 domain-containing protein [Myxococcales bacterium]
MTLLALLALQAGCSAALPGRVTARVVQISIPTYDVGGDDPTPRLFEDRGIYPYAMQDDVGRAVKARPRTYRAVLLENAYTRVIVMPALGGKIYAAHDKTNGGADFIYHNRVVKPALVALRGAWVSGGVEWNFPSFGHTINTYAPVPFVIEHHRDGSASVVVGTTERVRRLRWTVRVRLRPGRSAVEHVARLVNPTPFHRRAYFWVNGAVHARRDTRVVMPTNAIFFGAREDPQPWPGKKPDRSYYGRIAEPKDHFSALPADFIAAYHEKLDRGTAHYAARRQSAGKKFFTWGTAREGAMWEPLLTDSSGRYIELQSGRLLSQQDTWIFEPQSVTRVSGSWYALRGIGGVDVVGAEAAMHVERVGPRRYRVGLNATAQRPRAELLVLAGARVVRREVVQVGPARPWRRELMLPADVTSAAALAQLGLRFVLRARDGRLLVAHGVGAARRRYGRPEVRPALAGGDAEMLYLRGRRALLEWRRTAALGILRRAAEKGSARARRLLGEQLLIFGEPQAALVQLDAALARDEHDSRARSYRGLARLRVGERKAGRDDLARAAASVGQRRVALLAQGCDAMSRGRFDEALS